MNVKGLLHDISFKVHKGEILGFAGLMGAGRTEVMETLFGIRKMESGSIRIDGKEVQMHSPKEAMKHKIAFLTEDRRGSGCFLPLSVGTTSWSVIITRRSAALGRSAFPKRRGCARSRSRNMR